jgi:hypothetical protein
MLLESILGYDASTLDGRVEPIATQELGVAFEAED